MESLNQDQQRRARDRWPFLAGLSWTSTDSNHRNLPVFLSIRINTPKMVASLLEEIGLRHKVKDDSAEDMWRQALKVASEEDQFAELMDKVLERYSNLETDLDMRLQSLAPEAEGPVRVEEEALKTDVSDNSDRLMEALKAAMKLGADKVVLGALGEAFLQDSEADEAEVLNACQTCDRDDLVQHLGKALKKLSEADIEVRGWIAMHLPFLLGPVGLVKGVDGQVEGVNRSCGAAKGVELRVEVSCIAVMDCLLALATGREIQLIRLPDPDPEMPVGAKIKEMLSSAKYIPVKTSTLSGEGDAEAVIDGQKEQMPKSTSERVLLDAFAQTHMSPRRRKFGTPYKAARSELKEDRPALFTVFDAGNDAHVARGFQRALLKEGYPLDIVLTDKPTQTVLNIEYYLLRYFLTLLPSKNQ